MSSCPTWGGFTIHEPLHGRFLYIGLMAYSTYLQLVESYGASLLTRLASRRDDPSTLDPAVVEARCLAALEEASGFMDGFFQTVHVVPVVTTVASGLSLLRNCCEQIAISYLVLRRGYLPRSEDETLVLAQDRWRAFLRDVSSGKATIPGVAASDAAAAGSLPSDGFFIGSEEPFFPEASTFF